MQNVRQQGINIEKIKNTLKASVSAGKLLKNIYVTDIYASDLMSDVLAYGKTGSILLTGLNSIQAAISTYVAEFKGIIILRGKIPDTDMLSFAKDKKLFVLSTDADMYEACVKIANIKGEVPVIESITEATKKQGIVSTHTFVIDGQDFASAGMVSTHVKSILKSIGYDLSLIRRIAISTYEAEMNVVMHARRADVVLYASDREVKVIINDEGKGIENIELAMQEGYSTATEEQRAMGFGAGMGLPNIKKNSDIFRIESNVNKGTFVETIFYVK